MIEMEEKKVVKIPKKMLIKNIEKAKVLRGIELEGKKKFFSSGRICQSKMIKKGSHYRIYSAIMIGPGSTVYASDDFGASWFQLAPSIAEGNESKVEELPDGSLLHSCRISGRPGRIFRLYKYTDDSHKEVSIHVEYLACPDIEGKTLILTDPMLATGGSMELGYKALLSKGTPRHVHVACVIAAPDGIDAVRKALPDANTTVWCAAIDPQLNEYKYIVPGFGDAGDLCFGEK